MMTIQDLIAEIVLAAFDRLKDWLTLGSWTHVRGSEIPNIKVKEM